LLCIPIQVPKMFLQRMMMPLL